MTTVQEIITLNIRKKRISLGFTQQYMAEQLNKSQNYYNKIEVGRTKLTLVTLIKICEIFKISVGDFLDPIIKERGKPRA